MVKKFKVKPVYLSPEHAKQAERFQGYPYNPEEDARMKAYAQFKQYHQALLTARDSALPRKRKTGKRHTQAESPAPETSGSRRPCGDVLPFRKR